MQQPYRYICNLQVAHPTSSGQATTLERLIPQPFANQEQTIPQSVRHRRKKKFLPTNVRSCRRKSDEGREGERGFPRDTLTDFLPTLRKTQTQRRWGEEKQKEKVCLSDWVSMLWNQAKPINKKIVFFFVNKSKENVLCVREVGVAAREDKEDDSILTGRKYVLKNNSQQKQTRKCFQRKNVNNAPGKSTCLAPLFICRHYHNYYWKQLKVKYKTTFGADVFTFFFFYLAAVSFAPRESLYFCVSHLDGCQDYWQFSAEMRLMVNQLLRKKWSLLFFWSKAHGLGAKIRTTLNWWHKQKLE